MMMKNESLTKLIDFIVDVTNKPGHEWFKSDLLKKLARSDEHINSIKEIHEYCIKAIIKAQAEQFYQKFNLPLIKEQLITDFVRMEQFRRENRFEDFALALFQQIENITNHLCAHDSKFCGYMKLNQNTITQTITNKNTGETTSYKLSGLISYNSTAEQLDQLFKRKMATWEFKQKFRAVLFYFYFNKRLTNYLTFKSKFDLANELYQARNMNHRGGYQYDMQRETSSRIMSEQNRYYYRFLGFLEEFTNKINDSIEVSNEAKIGVL